MALTSASLQSQFDELNASTPVLALNMVPRSLDAADLIALARLEGKEAVRAVAAALQKAANDIEECHLCGQAGQPSKSAPADPDELAFTVACALDFAKKQVRIHRGGFACGRCRALSGSLSRLLKQAATALAGSQHGSDHRHTLLQELFLHLAVVNGAEAHITGNPDALAVWAQELLSRAYALQVVASSIRGWQLVGPASTPFARGSPGVTLQLLQELLAESGTLAATNSAKQQTSEATALKRKHAQQQEQPQQGPKQRGSKGSATPKHVREEQSTEHIMAAAGTQHKKPKAAPNSPTTPVHSKGRLPAAEFSCGANGHAASRSTKAGHEADAVTTPVRISASGNKKRLRGPVVMPDEDTAAPAVQQNHASSSKKAPRQHTALGSDSAAAAAAQHTPASAKQQRKGGMAAVGAASSAAVQRTPASSKQQLRAAMTAAKPKRNGDGSKRRKSM